MSRKHWIIYFAAVALAIAFFATTMFIVTFDCSVR